jgi:NAD(P)-dependent dehydrogenase (short-subunit alcohol dehydrogenase family)
LSTEPDIRASTLAGRRILVTGAARGIGRATAERMVAAGARVALVDRRAEMLGEAAATLAMPHFACDVREREQVAATIAEAETALGGLDGLVNAAGISIGGTIDEMDPDGWQKVMAVNLFGPFLMVKEAVAALRRAERATIVNIASIGALRPARGVSAYAASKAGLLMFGKCMAFELGPAIRVNTICPGTIETEMTRGLLTDEATRTRLSTGNALGRLGQPEEIAEAVTFLTDHQSSYVNGATLVVDGGYVWL